MHLVNVSLLQGAPHSVTGVLYLLDDRSLATSGAADGSVSFGSQWGYAFNFTWMIAHVVEILLNLCALDLQDY